MYSVLMPQEMSNQHSGSQISYAVTSNLLNPYRTNWHGFQQIYNVPSQVPFAQTNSLGYTLSSTYKPEEHGKDTSSSYAPQHHKRQRDSSSTHVNHQRGYWYEPGSHRCTYKGCVFTGSRKSVEIHMMDRHLIFPRDWDHKNMHTWDADPSLKNGRPLAILGTDIILDTPEALDKWILERKKRWPSSARIEDRKRKLEEASIRGQLSTHSQRLQGNKKRRVDGDYGRQSGIAGRKDRGSRIKERNAHREVWRREKGNVEQHPSASSSLSSRPTGDSNTPSVSLSALQGSSLKPFLQQSADLDTDSSSGSDMDPERDALPSLPMELTVANEIRALSISEEKEMVNSNDAESKGKDKASAGFPKPNRSTGLPKTPQQNPFVQRRNLLHSLLTPEIRMTVSNFSQCIRFLVENDFLRDVEDTTSDRKQTLIEEVANDF